MLLALGAPAAAAPPPDLSGYWALDYALRPVLYPPKPGPLGLPRGWMTLGGWAGNEPPPLRSEALERVRRRQQEELDGAVIEARTLKCLRSNAFDMMSFTEPLDIHQRPDKLVILSERELALPRHVYIGDRPPPSAAEPPTINGRSVAWWEGDTLVIDTEGLAPETWLFVVDFIPHAGARVRERIRLEEQGQVLAVQWTIVDGATFTKPWVVNLRYRRQPPDTRAVESVCDPERRAAEMGH